MRRQQTTVGVARPRLARRLVKPLVFVACSLPFARLVAEVAGLGELGLGANPIEELLERCGTWGLNLLLITLTVTPLRRLMGWLWLVRLRRMLGLFAFFYLCLHFFVYLVLDHSLALPDILEDIVERPFITIGFAGFLLLIPLAVTSTNRMMRRLGSRWHRLHRLIYPIAILGVWHHYWQVKQDIREPLIYVAILAALLGYRAWHARAREPRLQLRRGTVPETASVNR